MNEEKTKVQKPEKRNLHQGVVDMVMIALFTALIAVCTMVTIPIPPVPFTLQTLAVFLAGGLLGAKRGTISVFIYILLGKILKSHCCHHFEKRWMKRLKKVLLVRDKIYNIFGRNGLAVHTDSFTKIYKMRRRIQASLITGTLQNSC